MEILSTWQFWVGVVVAFILVFIVWVICAAGSKRSRMEEKFEGVTAVWREGKDADYIVYEAGERERMRRGKPDVEIVTQNNPRTD